MSRIGKQEYYLNIAQTVAERATCLRRKYGAVIVSKHDNIVSSGYNGAPRGVEDCLERGYCTREKLQIPSGERYELCKSVHAEQNAIIAAERDDMVGSTIYLSGIDSKTGEVLDTPEPCMLCKRFIINAGIETVVMKRKGEFVEEDPRKWIEDDLV